MGGQVMVVDDERELLELICMVLRDEGYRVSCLDHPAAALELSREIRPDVVLIDLMLPEMSGIDLAGRLREGECPDTPLIAMSASASMLRAAADSQLFQGTMRKPFDLTDLLHVMESHSS